MLVNKHSLAAAGFAAKSSNRPALSALAITQTHAVATDSYQLLEVEHPSQDSTEVPQGIRNDSGTGLVPAASALAAMKNVPGKPPVPVLAQAFTSVNPDGARMTLTTSDLESEKKVDAALIQGTYPDYQQVFPQEQPAAQITIDARMLKTMADYFAKHGFGAQVTLDVYGPDKPLVFRGITKGTEQKVRGLIMPQRMSDSAAQQ